MRKTIASLTALSVVAAFVAIGAFSIPTVAEQAGQEPNPANQEPAPFNPQMGALMNMIIQPRHAKLGLAGQNENWALAGYMFKELKQGFVVVSKAVPRHKGLPVGELIDAAVTPTFPVLDFAIKAGEPHQFMEAFNKLTAGCNNCHTTMDHPFVVIKTPDASAWPNQEFKPAGR